MSAAGVQRAIVRMMFDPAFRDAVYADAVGALAGCDVDLVERGWLVRPDRRAYATDGTRRARALHAIEAELPAAMAWARSEGRVMEDFFASEHLHRCIEDRGVLTLSFAAWLGCGASPALATLVELEGAVARARRGAVRTSDGRGIVLSPRVALVEAPEGALAWWSAVREAAAAGSALPSAPEAGDRGLVLVEVDAAGEARAELLAEGLAALLVAARAPIERPALHAHAVALGLEPADADELLDDLLASGLLAAT